MSGYADSMRIASQFSALAVQVPAEAKTVVRLLGAHGLREVKRRARGRPGPRRRTGDYLRSMTVQYLSSGGDHVAIIGTNAPQARRLEYGFTGRDSLDRYFEQDPLPHWRPAADALERTAANMFDTMLARVIR